MINIRKATAIDYPIIYEVVKASFKDAEHCDGNEKDLVIALSKSNAYIPELSLVAEENGEIIGHILFTQAQVGEKSSWLSHHSPFCQNIREKASEVL